ncbi:hypothetical protein CH380_15230 [Leptospira adleri]|uniref:Uncharacterized protein n=1 Tax=Leptospira adleri TaxID=2023186 RepID=A0A2M9YLT4_9LEPT|nr:hypothetical protein CH380_15230 [Leptospira adleri]PJZ63684.1 hypothetical protein CH376_02245 [Leptospira adleri]
MFRLEAIIQSHKRVDLLAAAIGFNEFRPGRHKTRDRRNGKTRESDVTASWIGFFMPSFSVHSAVMGFDVSALTYDRKPLDPIYRTAIATFEPRSIDPIDIYVLDSERKFDPLNAALAELPWNSTEWHLTLDGTSYTFLSQTMTLSGFLSFANPIEKSLLNLIKLMKESQTEILENGNRLDIGNPRM